jgi:hypothetical protein
MHGTTQEVLARFSYLILGNFMENRYGTSVFTCLMKTLCEELCLYMYITKCLVEGKMFQTKVVEEKLMSSTLSPQVLRISR